MPNLYIIAGCNGAGKTTTSYTVLPEMLNCKEFVNADEIARGLSPFQPETVSFQAGRIMLKRIKELLSGKNDFGFETTLATRSYVHLIKQAKKLGYEVVLIFFWLESVDLAKARVKARVEKGGHNIPTDIIERRYKRGLENLFAFYKNHSDKWLIYDNSKEFPVEVAEGTFTFVKHIYNDDLWKKNIGKQMSVADSDQLTRKITEGVKLAIKRLIERTQKEDGELVISRNGKVVRVKASDLKTE